MGSSYWASKTKTKQTILIVLAIVIALALAAWVAVIFFGVRFLSSDSGKAAIQQFGRAAPLVV